MQTYSIYLTHHSSLEDMYIVTSHGTYKIIYLFLTTLGCTFVQFRKEQIQSRAGKVYISCHEWSVDTVLKQEKVVTESKFLSTDHHAIIHLSVDQLQRSRAGHTSTYAKVTKRFHLVSRLIKLISTYLKSNYCTRKCFSVTVRYKDSPCNRFSLNKSSSPSSDTS